MTQSRPVACLLALLAACSSRSDSDAADACFTCDADDFGIEDGSCEADALLALVGSATLPELDDVIGLDQRAAEAIIDARPIGTLDELDQVPFVGPLAVEKLLAHLETTGELPCTDVTALVIPLVDEDDELLLSRFNDQFIAAGLEPFPDAVVVVERETWDAMMKRVSEASDKVGTPGALTGQPGPDSFGDFQSCYRGDAEKIPALANSLFDQALADVFAVIAWRFKDRKEFLFEEATDETVGGAVPAWNTFPTDTENLFIVHTFGDDSAVGTRVEPCD